MKKRNFFWSQSSTPHLPSLRSVSNWGQRSHYCCTESFQCRLYFGIMNLSVLVIESSVASTNQIAKGMLLASIRFVKFTPTNQIRYSLRADQRKTGVTLLLGIFGERFTGGTGTSFSVPQPSSCVLHSVLLPSLIDRFRTLPSVSRCCQPIFGRIRLCSHIRLQTWRVWYAWSTRVTRVDHGLLKRGKSWVPFQLGCFPMWLNAELFDGT